MKIFVPVIIPDNKARELAGLVSPLERSALEHIDPKKRTSMERLRSILRNDLAEVCETHLDNLMEGK